jgi:hypothetical protein
MRKPKPKTPASFTGDREKWITFMIDASIYFSHYPEFFKGDRTKAVYFLGWFEGKTVRPWADEILATVGQIYPSAFLDDFGALVERASILWGPLNQKQNAQSELDKIHQETTVSAYHAKFAPLATRSKYNEETLTRIFYNIKRPDTVETLLEAALEFESRILERVEERKALEQKPRPEGRFTSQKETAKAGRLTEEERKKHMKEGRCFICHMIGHLANKCPQKEAKAKKGTAEDDEERLEEKKDFPPA